MADKQSSSWAVIGICLTAIAIGWTVQSQKMQSIEAARRIVYHEKAVSLGASIEKHLVEAVEISVAMRAVLAKLPNISRGGYASLAEELRRDRGHILNVAYAPEMVVEYVHPVQGNEAVLGFDIRTRADQWSSAMTAAEVDMPVIAGPVALVQGGYGFIVRLPVYDENGADLKNLTGLISVVVSIEPVSDLVANVSQENAFVAIRGIDGMGEVAGLILGPVHVFEHDPVLYDVDLPYGQWQVGIHLDRPWNQLPAATLLNLWGAVVAMAVCAIVIFLTALRLQSGKERAEHDLAAAIDSIEDGFAMFDPEDRLILCNSTYADLYDLPRHLQAPGTPFEDILRFGIDRGQYPEAHGREMEWLSERLHLHRNPTGSFNQLFADGRWVKVAESRTRNGSIVGFRVNITDLKKAQEAAERAHQIKSQFLNNINHEMRTPLTVMLGYAPILGNIRHLASFKKVAAEFEAHDPVRSLTPILDGLADEVSGLSVKMLSSGRHLLNLINDTLDLSKIEAGEMRIDLQPVALAPLIASLVEEFTLKIKDKNIKMESAVTDYIVMADELRLRQILVNLIGNAVKFTNEGTIEIRTEERETKLDIIVSDTGCGIATRNLSKIFDEFFQEDASTTRNFGGTGLGLAISRDLAELQGGNIRAESVEGKGSSFYLTLPIFQERDIRTVQTAGEHSHIEHSGDARMSKLRKYAAE